MPKPTSKSCTIKKQVKSVVAFACDLEYWLLSQKNVELCRWLLGNLAKYRAKFTSPMTIEEIAVPLTMYAAIWMTNDQELHYEQKLISYAPLARRDADENKG